MAFLALAAGFSPKQSTLGVWICITVACVFIVLFAHDFTAGKSWAWIGALMRAAPVCVVVIVYGWWLSSPPLLVVVFRSPQKLNVVQRTEIRWWMTGFRQYMRDLGFDVPPTLPSVGIGDLPGVPGSPHGARHGVAVTAGSTSDYSWVLVLGPDKPADEFMVVHGYCTQMFYTFWDVLNGKPDMIARSVSQKNFCDYLTYSYLGNLGREVTSRWLSAMWAVREAYGAAFMDRSVTYTYRMFDDPNDSLYTTETITDAKFDEYFSRKLLRGIEQMDLSDETQAKVTQIFQTYGIHVNAASSEEKK